MSLYEFRAPALILHGEGTFAAASTQAARFGRHALIVSDPVMLSSGLVDQLRSYLREQGAATSVFTGVTGEPTDEMVEAGLTALREGDCDLVVALGGGSPMDTAKAIGVLATNGGNIADYMGQNKIAKPGLPLICVPTTAGTGSEVTRFSVITDHSNDVKMLIGSPHLIPTVAVLDPALTWGLPPLPTAATALDALTHAIEAYVSRRANPLTDTLAIQAIRRISGNLRQAWANGQNRQAREQVLLGAMEAGLAFSNASVALVHGMSRPIGAVFHVPHGLSNAILLSIVMRYSLPACPERYGEIAAAMGEPVAGLRMMDGAHRALVAVEELCRDLQVPSPRAAGVDPEKLRKMAPKMAEDALISGSPGNNPRVPSKEEIIALYHELANQG